MKKMIKSFLWTIIALQVLFSSCKDYLDVQSDSRFSEEYVYERKTDLELLLASVYVSILSNHLYGEKYMQHYALNSDVEFTQFNSLIRDTRGNDFRCFDGESHSTHAAETWEAAYQGVERANLLINGILNSPIYDESDAELMQILGEGITLRAMIMHDLVVHFGDIPFPKVPTFQREEMVPPIRYREEILSEIINEVIEIAPFMRSSAEVTIERASQDFAWALIARMSLTRGGYSLRPIRANPLAVGEMQKEIDFREYYLIARDYADSVIFNARHSLTKPFVDVFIDQCNYIVAIGDDPIFELPFVRDRSGEVGFRHGPQVVTQLDEGRATSNWGESGGNIRLNAFYFYSFDIEDLRREATVGFWSYSNTGVPTILANTRLDNFANKWSKLWATPGNALGFGSGGSTGFNYPYMRYADVLLMYAEAVNELENGVSGENGEKAKEALRTVRRRAFPTNLHNEKVNQYVNAASVSKEAFFEAIFNERKWEFGGENMRWKDLVRWNLYAQVVYKTFMDFYTMASFKNAEYLDGWEEFDENYPKNIYYRIIDNNLQISPKFRFQNTILQVLDIEGLDPDASGNFRTTSPGAAYTGLAPFNWGTSDQTYPRDEVLYSFRGYIRGGLTANYRLIDPRNPPPVRYILPMPRQVIMLSQGNQDGYRNYYGY